MCLQNKRAAPGIVPDQGQPCIGSKVWEQKKKLIGFETCSLVNQSQEYIANCNMQPSMLLYIHCFFIYITIGVHGGLHFYLFIENLFSQYKIFQFQSHI